MCTRTYINCISDTLNDFLSRARDILRAKIDPSSSLSQTDLTAEVDAMVQKAQSK